MTVTMYGSGLKLPATIYHYTSADVMMKMLLHNTGVELCCTDFRDLNDETEFSLGYEKSLEWLGTRESDLSIVGKVHEILENPVAYGIIPYIASFSSEADSVPHWMVYSNKGEGGVAIGFDVDGLRKCVSEIDKKLKHTKKCGMRGGALVAPCVYVDKNNECLDCLQNMLEYVFSDLEIFSTLKDKQPQVYAEYCARHIVMISALVKSAEFEFEKECRLILVPLGGSMDRRLRIIGNKTRVSLKPYVPHSVVSKIVVSPHGRKDVIMRSAEAIMRLSNDFVKGYSYEVESSNSSYNGR